MSKVAIVNDWLFNHKNQISNYLLFVLTVLFGTFIKIHKEPNTPKKWHLPRVIAEICVSFLVGSTIYCINKYYFNLPIIMAMVLCAWGGSISGTLHKKFEELVISIFENLKVFFSNRIQNLIIIFSVLIFATSCKTSKPIITNTTETNKKEIEKIIVTNEVVKNKEIIDSLKISISKIKTVRPECDSITNAEIIKLLKLINSKKQSGENTYGIYFDEIKNELVSYAKIGETKDQKIKQLNSKLLIESLKKQKEIPVKYTPKYVQYLAYFGLLALIILVFIVVNKLKNSLPV